MDEINEFLNLHLDDIKKKDRKIKDINDARKYLLQSSIFYIKANPKVFDWKRYIQTFPDLRKALKNSEEAAHHYLSYGIRERRQVYVLDSNEPYKHEFNWKDYITINMHLRYLLSDVDAFHHFITGGYKTHKATIKEMAIINDRIEITDNEDTNKKWKYLLSKNLNVLNDEVYITPRVIGDSVYRSDLFKCINIENNKSYDELISNLNGDCINETNFIKNVLDKRITLYYNNVFISGNRNLKPQITISRNKNFNNINNKNNVFLSPIPYKNQSHGLYFITESMVEAIQNKKSLLYPHVFNYKLYDEINTKPFFLQKQISNKDWYNWKTNEEVKQLKLQYFSEDAFVICICGRIAINSYPKSLLEAIKLLRNQGYNIHLLALTNFEVRPERLTQNLYNEITSYDWVKSFTVEKKEVLNYFRFCDVLASTYRDFCNHVGGSNKMNEYLLCDKPILCSRGRERERELGKDYFGLYDCETCNTVPPLCWTEEYIKNPRCYKDQYKKYFQNSDLNGGSKSEINFSVGFIKQFIEKKCIVAVIPVLGREPLLKYTIRRAFEKNKVNYVIVVGESESEYETAKSEGAIFLKHQNRPLGKKWNAGFMYAKRFNPDALLFIGSSDWISDCWLDRAYPEILKGAGYVGKMDFDMIDFINEKTRMCKWYGYTCDRKHETIGIGRLVSRKLLEAVNYCPFPDSKENSMDYGMYLHCTNHKMPIKILDNDSIFLAVTCDLWTNMHEFDMHYYGSMPNSEDLYKKDRSGCKNIRRRNNIQYCDIHPETGTGCIRDIEIFNEYKSLFQNGKIYNENDIDRLYKEFPELNDLYNDYLRIKKTGNIKPLTGKIK